MMKRVDSEIEVYIGSPVEYESERLALGQAVATLSNGNAAAVILANVTLSSRQIDLIVATEAYVLVVEAKGSTRPVRGGENGVWEFLSATGEWRNTGRNWYQQALGAKNALHDAMKEFSGEEVPYPEAALIFAPFLLDSSDVPTGDFKVKVDDLTALQDFGELKKSANWSLDQWRNLARRHWLTRVHTLEGAFDESLIRAAALLEEYRAAFTAFYDRQTQGLVPFSCEIGESETESTEVVTRVAAGGGLLIVGPSGCGKSMLAKHIGVKCAEAAQIPIIVEAIHFSGDFGELLNQEAALLDVPSISSLVSASRRCGTPLVVLLDGFNECPQPLRERLARCHRAIAIRYQAKLVVTSQAAFSELQILNLDTANVPEPSMAVKKQIACLPEELSASEKAEELLSLAKSGLEARIVGQVIRDVGPGISRYGLFDAYVRERLADDAQAGIGILAAIAEYLSERISFRMSVRDFDRLMGANGWLPNAAESLFKAGIIARRKDSLIFGHEQYLTAFSSEAVVRAARMNAASILSAMCAPKHSAYAALILGAIDDTRLLEQVLAGVTDSSVIVACATGECGSYAGEWVARHYSAVLQSLEDEASSVRFAIDNRGWMSLVPIPESMQSWSDQDRAFLDALPDLLGRGQYLDEVFIIAGAMDARLAEEFDSLKAEAAGKNIGLRSGLFGTSFGNQNSDVAIGRIVARIALSRSLSRNAVSEGVAAWAKSKVTAPRLSNGQLYMLLEVCRHLWDRSPIIEVLPDLIRQRWRYAPYHLCLQLLDAAQYSWDRTDEQKAALIAAIESIETNNIMLSTSIIDALKSLGALEDIGYEHTVRNEVDEALSDPSNPENWTLARAIYDRQFDHPYEAAYWEVVNVLPDEKRKQLLTLAVRHKDEYRMFVPCMIGDLAKYGDVANGSDIERWTELPPKNNPMPQDAVGAFSIAHVVLGKLGCEVQPKAYGQSDEDDAMLACGEIYYWINRDDVSLEERRERCESALQILLKHEAGVALPALRVCENALRSNLNAIADKKEVSASIVSSFPGEVAEMCREALTHRIPQHVRGVSMWDGGFLDYAAHLLGYCGKHTDLHLLRGLVDDDRIGGTAVRAVRRLEERLTA